MFNSNPLLIFYGIDADSYCNLMVFVHLLSQNLIISCTVSDYVFDLNAYARRKNYQETSVW